MALHQRWLSSNLRPQVLLAWRGQCATRTKRGSDCDNQAHGGGGASRRAAVLGDKVRVLEAWDLALATGSACGSASRGAADSKLSEVSFVNGWPSTYSTRVTIVADNGSNGVKVRWELHSVPGRVPSGQLGARSNSRALLIAAWVPPQLSGST